jgi:hypothetical protein
MLTVDYDTVMPFSACELGQYFVFAHEVGWMNDCLRHCKSVHGNKELPFILANVKVSDGEYRSDNKYVIADFRNRKDMIPANYHGYIYSEVFVFPLVRSNENSDTRENMVTEVL